MDSKAPFFKFYPTDFTGDAKVQLMSTEAIGAYILLLCAAWQQRPRGTLPNNNKMLARWARMSDDDWMSLRDEVLIPFQIEDDLITQPRLASEALDMEEKHRKLSEAGKRGAATRKERGGYGEASGEASGEVVAYQKPEARSQRPEEVTSADRFVHKSAVERAWGCLPLNRQRGKSRFRDAFIEKVLRPGVNLEDVCDTLAAYYMSEEGKGQYARMPARFIEDEGFNEDPSAWFRDGDSPEDSQRAEEGEDWLQSLEASDG